MALSLHADAVRQLGAKRLAEQAGLTALRCSAALRQRFLRLMTEFRVPYNNTVGSCPWPHAQLKWQITAEMRLNSCILQQATGSWHRIARLWT